MSSHSLLQGIFPTQRSNLSLLCLFCVGKWVLYHCATWAFCWIWPIPPSRSCMGKLVPRPFPSTVTFGFCQSDRSRAILDYLGHSGGVMRSRGVYRSSTQMSIHALSPAMRFLAVTLGGARSQPQRGDCPLQSGPSLPAVSCHQSSPSKNAGFTPCAEPFTWVMTFDPITTLWSSYLTPILQMEKPQDGGLERVRVLP